MLSSNLKIETNDSIKILINACKQYKNNNKFFKTDYVISAQKVIDACESLLTNDFYDDKQKRFQIAALYMGLESYLTNKQNVEFLAILKASAEKMKIDQLKKGLEQDKLKQFSIKILDVLNKNNNSNNVDHLSIFINDPKHEELPFVNKTFSLNDDDQLSRQIPNILNQIQGYLPQDSIKAWSCSSRFFADFLATKKPKVSWPFKIEKLVANFNYAFVLLKSGKWYAFGKNDFGQLALGHNNDINTPAQFTPPNNETIKSITMSSLGTFFLCESGHLFVCGYNKHGELGLGHNNDINTPAQFTLPNDEKVKSVTITINQKHIFLVCESGHLFVYDSDYDAKPSLGHNNPVGNPTQLRLPNDERIKSVTITIDGRKTFLLCESGDLFVYDSNYYAEPWTGDNNPVKTPTQIILPNEEKIKSVTTEECNMFLLCESGHLFVYGDNFLGVLGLGHNNPVKTPTQLILPNEEKIKSVTTDINNIFLLCESGHLFVYGSNNYGELGLGHNNSVKTPTQLILPNEEKIKSVTRNEYGTFFLCESGYFYLGNDENQLYLKNPIMKFGWWLNPKQKDRIDALVNEMSSNKPTNAGQFLGHLFLAYANTKSSLFTAQPDNQLIAKRIGVSLLGQQQRNYSACLQLINAELLSLTGELMKYEDNDLNLFCLWKALYQKDFQARFENIITENNKAKTLVNAKEKKSSLPHPSTSASDVAKLLAFKPAIPSPASTKENKEEEEEEVELSVISSVPSIF